MAEQSNEPNHQNGGKINMEMLIAFCAVLISVASFYATFLQANAAEKQVTAMTLPLMNFTTGNYDSESQSQVLTFTLANKGVGPAKVETFLIKYKNRYYKDHGDYLRACCTKGYEELLEARDPSTFHLPLLVSDEPQQQIMPSGEEMKFLLMAKHPANSTLWQAVDKARIDTSLAVCYCSLLDNCYWLTGKNQISETPNCQE